METEEQSSSGTDAAPPERTLPGNISVQVSGLSKEDATKLGHSILAFAGELSRYIDLDRLDGITVAYDYADALAKLDRGYETTHKLTPSTELAWGIAMTPSVKREGIIKSHIVFNAAVIFPLHDMENEHFDEALHILAHECAHVEITKATDVAFPHTLLEKQYDNLLDAFTGQIISACWDEYAACRISANFGKDSLPAYSETFVLALQEIRLRANECIRSYRIHGNHGRILEEVAGYYGDLLKFASYLLGHVDGKGIEIAEVSAVAEALGDHWFEPFFQQLHKALRAIWDQFGQWESPELFDVIGSIVIDLLADIGMTFYQNDDGGFGFNLPYRADTMPVGFGWLTELSK